jgi:hypothetical protein
LLLLLLLLLLLFLFPNRESRLSAPDRILLQIR